MSSNPTQVNIFQLTSAGSDYHENFLFMYVSEDDSERALRFQSYYRCMILCLMPLFIEHYLCFLSLSHDFIF